jgi:hypothetical protein
MQVTQGSLVIIGLNTSTPQVFWNGVLLANVVGIYSNVDTDDCLEDNKIKLRVTDTLEVYTELLAAGIIVKKVTK